MKETRLAGNYIENFKLLASPYKSKKDHIKFETPTSGNKSQKRIFRSDSYKSNIFPNKETLDKYELRYMRCCREMYNFMKHTKNYEMRGNLPLIKCSFITINKALHIIPEKEHLENRKVKNHSFVWPNAKVLLTSFIEAQSMRTSNTIFLRNANFWTNRNVLKFFEIVGSDDNGQN